MKKRHISPEQVEHLAWLARINLSTEEREQFASQLDDILVYFEKLDSAPTECVSPSTHLRGLANVLRPDQPGPSLDKEEAFANVPKREGDHIKAPRIV